MPVCYCASAGCGTLRGRSVDGRTLKNHTRADEALHYQARETSQHAADEQEEIIAQCFASLALSDDPYENQGVSGNRMWHGKVPSQSGLRLDYSTGTSGRNAGTTQLTNVERVLQRLSEIDAAVDVLRKDATRSVASMNDGNAGKSLIKNLSARVKELDDDLQRAVTRDYKKRSVAELRQSVGRKLGDVYTTLSNALESRKAMKQKRHDEPAYPHTHRNIYHSDHFFKPILPDVDPVLQISYFLVVACYVVFHIGRRGCNFILTALSYIIHAAAVQGGMSNRPSQHDHKVIADFVKDVRIPTDHFNLNGKYTIYAICPDPTCHHSYKPTFLPDDPVPQYPSRCNYSRFPGAVCNERLLRPKTIGDRNIINVPIKPFLYFCFKEWLASLLSRPGFEERMDKTWGNSVCDDQQEMHDIFDGDLLRNFIGPDGKRFGTSNTVGEYVFSLNVDFFNPNGNKAAGKSFSCGIIAMVCLNLPPELRYQPENMYLAGIIPGPAEPPTACINNYIRPLVDDLLDFWTPGVQFSRTHQFRHGRPVVCALVAVVCDLPASRKVAGFASHAHEFFCSICYCTRKKDGYGTTNYGSWHRRGDRDCREHAERWKSAYDASTAKAVLDSSGLRWSELLRLPYFDPSRFVVIDAMHNLFLGLINFHFCDLLGYRPSSIKKKEVKPVFLITFSEGWKEFTEPEQRSVEKMRGYLQSPITSELETAREKWHSRFTNCHLRALWFVCKDLKLVPPSTEASKLAKKEWANILIDWRKMHPDPVVPTLTVGRVISQEDREMTWALVRKLILPSWVSSVPYEFGSPGSGKVKADQWRTLGTIHLPIALALLWDSSDDDHKQLLDATFSLLSAIIIACSHVTSQGHANQYLGFMRNYVESIKKLFPDLGLLPNHHLALHLHEYLIQYGPVHSWWTFPFERLIGIIQRIPNNGKHGEFEETIAKSYTRAANFRSTLGRVENTDVLKHCKTILQDFLDPQSRGTLVMDIRGLNSANQQNGDESDDELTTIKESESHRRHAKELPHTTWFILKRDLGLRTPVRATYLAQNTIGGVTYSKLSKHAGNANILVKCKENKFPRPAKIVEILQMEQETVMLVQYHLEPPLQAHNPFHNYPVFQTSIWDVNLSPLFAIRPTQIISHFAELRTTQGDNELVLVISLSRVIRFPAITGTVHG